MTVEKISLYRVPVRDRAALLRPYVGRRVTVTARLGGKNARMTTLAGEIVGLALHASPTADACLILRADEPAAETWSIPMGNLGRIVALPKPAVAHVYVVPVDETHAELHAARCADIDAGIARQAPGAPGAYLVGVASFPQLGGATPGWFTLPHHCLSHLPERFGLPGDGMMAAGWRKRLRDQSAHYRDETAA